MDEDLFLGLKRNLELAESFDEHVQQRHIAIRNAIHSVKPGIHTQLIGSLQRKTRIHPRQHDEFDMDILVVLDTFSAWVQSGGWTPSSAEGQMRTIISDSRYESLNPVTDSPAIRITYADGVTAELVPAFVDNVGTAPSGIAHSPKQRAFWVPKNGAWALADYEYDAQFITSANKRSDEMLVPTIKMLKAAKREHFEDMGSFHLEIIAATIIPEVVAVCRSQGLVPSYELLISMFFRHAGDYLQSVVRLPGSLSQPINVSLAATLKLQTTFSEISRMIVRCAQQKNKSERVRFWRYIFGDCFPLS